MSNALMAAVTPHVQNGGRRRSKTDEQKMRDAGRIPDKDGTTRQKAKNRKVEPLPPAPSYYTKEQRAIWNEFKAVVDADRIATKKDVRAFELMVQSYMLIQAAWKELFKDALADKATEGECLTYEQQTKEGVIIKRRCEVDIIEKNHKILAYHFSRFGMTPADAARFENGGMDGSGAQTSGKKSTGLGEFEDGDE